MISDAILDVSLADIYHPRLYTRCTAVPNYIDTRNIFGEVLVIKVYGVEPTPSTIMTLLPVQRYLVVPRFARTDTLTIHPFSTRVTRQSSTQRLKPATTCLIRKITSLCFFKSTLLGNLLNPRLRPQPAHLSLLKRDL